MARPATWGTFDKTPRIGYNLLYYKRRSRSANRLSFAGAEVTPTSAATGPATRVPSRSASPTLSLRVAVGALIACDLRKTPKQGMARAISALSPSFQHPSQYPALDSTAFRGSYYFSRRSNSLSRIFTQDNLAQVRVVSAVAPPRSANAEAFFLAMEAHRIRFAYQFDPLFAVNASQVDPLPHQIEAVYHYQLPHPRIGFLLPNDPVLARPSWPGDC